MAFHAKALEVFTLAYQSIQSVDEEEDLEVRPGSAKENCHVPLAQQANKVLFVACDVSHYCLCLTSASYPLSHYSLTH